MPWYLQRCQGLMLPCITGRNCSHFTCSEVLPMYDKITAKPSPEHSHHPRNPPNLSNSEPNPPLQSQPFLDTCSQLVLEEEKPTQGSQISGAPTLPMHMNTELFHNK